MGVKSMVNDLKAISKLGQLAYLDTEIEYEHGCHTCSISTGDSKTVARIKSLSKKFPDKVKVVAINKDGSIYAKFPFRWLCIAPPIGEE